MKQLLIAATLLFSGLITAQFEITGTVEDELGVPLAFASVILQDSEDSNLIFGNKKLHLWNLGGELLN